MICHAASAGAAIESPNRDLRLHRSGDELHAHTAIVAQHHRKRLNCPVLSGTSLVPHTPNLASDNSGPPPRPTEWANTYPWSRVATVRAIRCQRLHYTSRLTALRYSGKDNWGSTAHTPVNGRSLPLISSNPGRGRPTLLRLHRFWVAVTAITPLRLRVLKAR